MNVGTSIYGILCIYLKWVRLYLLTADIGADIFRMLTTYMSAPCCTLYNLIRWELLFPLLHFVDKATEHKDG